MAFPPSRFVFPFSCRGGKRSYKKNKCRTWQVWGSACELGRLDAFWGIPGRGVWSADNHPLATPAVSRLENMNTHYSMICLYFISGNWNSISRLPWTCRRSHWVCWFCSCSRTCAQCGMSRVPAWLTVAAGNVTVGNRSGLCCVGASLVSPKTL